MKARALLPLLGVAWVLALAGAAVTKTRDFWPVSDGSLFSWETREVLSSELTGRAQDGRAVPMTAAGFGLQQHQLHQWLAKRVGSPEARAEGGPRVLARLARIWNRAHAEKIVGVELRLRHTPLPAGHGSSLEPLLSWAAP